MRVLPKSRKARIALAIVAGLTTGAAATAVVTKANRQTVAGACRKAIQSLGDWWMLQYRLFGRKGTEG